MVPWGAIGKFETVNFFMREGKISIICVLLVVQPNCEQRCEIDLFLR